MRDDDLKAADLGEAHGFADPAAALRALAAGTMAFHLPVFGMDYPDAVNDGFDPSDIAPTAVMVFRDRDAAERHARHLTAQTLRRFRPDRGNGPPACATEEEFNAQVSAILGVPYELPRGGSLFPDGATDDQLWRIGCLFDFTLYKLRKFGTDPSAESAPRPPRQPRSRPQRRPSPPPDDEADDFLACSDLCEENHLVRQAAMLRALAGAGDPVFIVAERDVEFTENGDHLFHPPSIGTPQALFFSRAEADDDALRRNADKLRDVPLTEYGTKLRNFTTLTRRELNRQISAVLGIDFRFPTSEDSDDEFPESATDEQMMAVARLLDKHRFYHVLEARFGG